MFSRRRTTTTATEDKAAVLYRKYKQSLYLTAYNILKDSQLAEDAIQTTFYKVIKHMDQIENMDDPEIKGYLYMIVKNVSIDMYNCRKKEQEVFQYFVDHLNRSYDELPVNEILADTGIGGEIEEYILSLKENDQTLIYLKYGLDLSHEDIAEILGVTNNAVRQRLSRAKKRLAGILLSRY